MRQQEATGKTGQNKERRTLSDLTELQAVEGGESPEGLQQPLSILENKQIESSVQIPT